MAIPNFSSYKNQGILRPREDISPKKKQEDDKYCLEYSRFIYGQYMSENCAIKDSMLELFRENRLYAEGRQSGQKYKDSFLGKESGPPIPTTDVDNDEEVDITPGEVNKILDGFANINYHDIFSPLPKYVSNIIGIMTSQEHDVTVEAEDERSGTLKEEMKFDTIVRQEHEELLKVYNQTFNLPELQNQGPKPKSLEEIELFENIGEFKLPYEIGMEKGLSHTEYISKDDDIKEEAIRDLITIGMTPHMTFVDPESGKVKYKWLDIENLILEDSAMNDYADSSFGGYVEYLTIVNLRAQTGWSEEKIMSIVNSVAGQYGNKSEADVSINQDGGFAYDDWRVAVLVSYWKSIDSEYNTTKRTKDGIAVDVPEHYKRNGTRAPKVGKLKDGKKTSRTDIRRIYQARWIMDTDHIYDYGLMHNIAFNYATSDVEFPIHMVKVKGKPIMESLKTIEDQIMMTFLRMQNDIATANPNGLAIEYGSLSNISFGNKKLQPKDVLKIFAKSGRLLYQLQPSGAPGQPSKVMNQKPITEIKGGIGQAMQDFAFSLGVFYQQLDVISGIDAITVANTRPTAAQGKAVTEIAISSTVDRLKPIYSGWLKIKRARSRCAAYTIQSIVYAYPKLSDCPYYKILGSGNIAAIHAAGPYPAVDYGFRFEPRPTQLEREEVLMAAKAGLAGGKNGIPSLTYSEYMFILRHVLNGVGKSIKYIQIYIAKKEADRNAEAHQRALETQQLQAEGAINIKKEEQNTIAFKLEGEEKKEKAVATTKGEQERLTEELKHQHKMVEIAATPAPIQTQKEKVSN